jgi:TM2 domain-containing membrane protein YozV/cold shock CspA family protein
MRGKVLGFDLHGKTGVISGDDGKRYSVVQSSLGSGVTALRSGQTVDFEVQEDAAVAVFPISGSDAQGGKSKIVAGLLAFFLGGFGIHKFYLGYSGAGILMLLVFLFGFILIGIPSAVIGIIALIEAVIYLCKSDDEFFETYVANKRAWF